MLSELEEIGKLETITKKINELPFLKNYESDFTFLILAPISFSLVAAVFMPALGALLNITDISYLETGLILGSLPVSFYSFIFFKQQNNKKAKELEFQKLQQQNLIESKNLDDYLSKINNELFLKKEELRKNNTFLHIAQKNLNNKNKEMLQYESTLQAVYGEKLEIKNIEQNFNISY